MEGSFIRALKTKTCASCHALMDEAISTAKDLKDRYALAHALAWAAGLGCAERRPAEVDRLASDLIELSTRHNFVFWRALGAIHRGWARSASGNNAEGIAWIEQGIRDYRASGAVLGLPYCWEKRPKHYIWRIELLKLWRPSQPLGHRGTRGEGAAAYLCRRARS